MGWDKVGWDGMGWDESLLRASFATYDIINQYDRSSSLSHRREDGLALVSCFGDISAVLLFRLLRLLLFVSFLRAIAQAWKPMGGFRHWPVRAALLSGYVGVCASFLKWWKCFFFVLRLRFVYVYYLYPRQKKVK